MFQKRMVSSEASDGEAGEPIAKSAFQDQAPYKRSRSGCRNSYRRRSSARLEHLFRSKRSITLTNHPMMMSSVFDRVVKKITLKNIDSSTGFHLDRFVYLPWLPASACLAE